MSFFLCVPDVSLSDPDSGVVDRVGESALEDLALQPPLEEFVDGQTQNVIESVFGVFVQKAEFEHSPEKSVSFEHSSLVVGFQSQKLSSCLSELGQHELDSPDLSLVLEPKAADQLHPKPSQPPETLAYSFSILSFSKGLRGVLEVLEAVSRNQEKVSREFKKNEYS